MPSNESKETVADNALKSSARTFIKQQGMTTLLDISIGVVNNFLVLKGIVSKEVLRNALAVAIDKASKAQIGIVDPDGVIFKSSQVKSPFSQVKSQLPQK